MSDRPSKASVGEVISTYRKSLDQHLATDRRFREHAPDMVAALEILRDNLVSYELLSNQYGNETAQTHAQAIRNALDPALAYVESKAEPVVDA